MRERGKSYGTPVKDLKEVDPKLYERIKTHLGDGALEFTCGQIQTTLDGDYGQVDPRVLAAQKAVGDFTAMGGNGPKANATTRK